jgi:hypothetical protein
MPWWSVVICCIATLIAAVVVSRIMFMRDFPAMFRLKTNSLEIIRRLMSERNDRQKWPDEMIWADASLAALIEFYRSFYPTEELREIERQDAATCNPDSNHQHGDKERIQI